MTKDTSKTGFVAKLMEFIDAFDTSGSDVIYDNIERSSNKLRELDARVARLENPNAELREVRHETAI